MIAGLGRVAAGEFTIRSRPASDRHAGAVTLDRDDDALGHPLLVRQPQEEGLDHGIIGFDLAANARDIDGNPERLLPSAADRTESELHLGRGESLGGDEDRLTAVIDERSRLDERQRLRLVGEDRCLRGGFFDRKEAACVRSSSGNERTLCPSTSGFPSTRSGSEPRYPAASTPRGREADRYSPR